MTFPASHSQPHFLAGPYLDRRSDEREQPQAITQARLNPLSRVLLAQGTALSVTGDPPRAGFLAINDPQLQALPDTAFTLLGWYESEPCLLLAWDVDARPLVSTPIDWRFEELRPLAAVLDRHEAGLLAYARALAYWQQRHRHCGRCGNPSRPNKAGHVMQCTAPECGESFFPRIDPAVIVLVSDGDRALLGRQPSWPEGRFSTIAGFVEPGESLEDAVAREVAEETGVSLREVRYHSSQPWPFPSSLMLGFMGKAHDAKITVGCELAEAHWFTRDDITQQRVILPPSTSISYRLIETWFDDYDGHPLRTLPSASWTAPVRKA
jgi:NAD+ diphosphatase